MRRDRPPWNASSVRHHVQYFALPLGSLGSRDTRGNGRGASTRSRVVLIAFRAEDGVKHVEVVTGHLVQNGLGWLRLASLNPCQFPPWIGETGITAAGNSGRGRAVGKWLVSCYRGCRVN